MKAKHLTPNLEVRISGGPLEGYTATVVDPTVVPDGQPEQRKVLVTVHEAGSGGSDIDMYILPRMLSVKPVESTLVEQAAPIIEAAALTNIERGVAQLSDPITDPMDPVLDRFRPDPDVVKRYISRKVPGGMKDTDFLLTIRDNRDDEGYSPNVALVGETQSGKTMLVQVLAVLAAKADGLPKPYPVFTLNGAMGITSYDLFGQTSAVTIDGRETLVWMDGLVPLACNCGGFLYLDEWNAVPPAQATALHPVLDDRRMFTNYQRAIPDEHGGYMPETVKANKNLWVLSTINPGYKGTQAMAEASTNRFMWFEWDYDAATERRLIPSSTVRAIGDALRTARTQRVLTVPVGSSALRRFNEMVASFGTQTAMWSLMAMFPPIERERVKTIIEDRGFEDLLEAEYPNPVFTGAGDKSDDSDNQPEPTVNDPFTFNSSNRTTP
jgi:MoxR-like ATPase